MAALAAVVMAAALIAFAWKSNDALIRIETAMRQGQDMSKEEATKHELTRQPDCAEIILEECDNLKLVLYRNEGESMTAWMERVKTEREEAIAAWGR